MFNWLWNTITRRAESPPANSQRNGDLRNDPSGTKNNTQVEQQHSVVDDGSINEVASNGKEDSHSISKRSKPFSDKRDQSPGSGYTSSKGIENWSKELLFYCPYRNCSYSAKLATTICEHIREEHDSTFFVLLSNDDAQSAIFTVTTPSNTFISLLDQNTAIEPTERLLAVNNENIDGDKRHQHYYCPYQECSYHRTTKDKQLDLIRHIRLNHYADLAYQDDMNHQCYRTMDGDVLVDFSEQYHSTLSSGTILIPCDANGHVHKQYADMINNLKPKTSISATGKMKIKSPKKRRKPVVEREPQQGESSTSSNTLESASATRRSKRRKRNVWKEDEWVLY